MDLLKSLIVPGTEAYARWASTAFRRPKGTTSCLSGLDGRRDSVQQSDDKIIPTNQGDDPNKSADEDLEEGEIDEAASIVHPRSRRPPTRDLDLIQPFEAASNSAAPLYPPGRGFRAKCRICFFWYHYQHCDRDPASPTRIGKPCPYIHSLEGVQSDVRISHFPRWMHKGPCGLELCPFKNTEWKPKPESRREEKQAHERENSVFGNKTDSRLMAPTKKTNNPNPEKKRKAARPHPDTPLSRGFKRQKLSYDDDGEGEATKPDRQSHKYSGAVKRQKFSHDNHSSTKPERNSDGDETCFFWYHGTCARPQERRRNYHCPFLHGLTNPPTMVKPPPGYVHRMPCELELCPGDASKNEVHGDKRYFEGTTKRMGGEQTSREKVDKEQDWYLSGFDDC